MTSDYTPDERSLIEDLDALGRADRAEPDAGFESRLARATEPETRVLPFASSPLVRVVLAAGALAAVVAVTALLPSASGPVAPDAGPLIAQGDDAEISDEELLAAFGFGVTEDAELAMIETTLIELEIDSAERAWLFEGSL